MINDNNLMMKPVNPSQEKSITYITTKAQTKIQYIGQQ